MVSLLLLLVGEVRKILVLAGNGSINGCILGDLLGEIIVEVFQLSLVELIRRLNFPEQHVLEVDASKEFMLLDLVPILFVPESVLRLRRMKEETRYI